MKDFIWDDDLVKEYVKWIKERSRPIYDPISEFKELHQSIKDYEIKGNKVLFTTEDGVDIYEGLKVSLLDSLNWHIAHSIIAPSTPFYGIDKQFKYFSSKEAAENYVLMNKPCLSLDDLLNVWNGSKCNSDSSKNFYSNAQLFQNFKKLAKQKNKDAL